MTAINRDGQLYWTFEKLDLIGALREVQTDVDMCKNAIFSSANEDSVLWWKKRYNRMAAVANALRLIISYDDPKFSEPYTTRKFDI